MNAEVPQLNKTPEPCPVCDTTIVLGLLTGACEGTKDGSKKSECLRILEPLERGKVKASDALKDAIVILGEDGLNDVVDRMNLLIYDATSRAKEELIAKGVLNPDGTPKDAPL